MSTIEDKTRRGGKVSKNKKRRKAPPAPPKPPLPVRIMPDMVERIDAVRDPMIPREPYVRWLVELGLTQVEAEG